MSRTITFGPDGQVISDVDTRTLEQARAETISSIREDAARRIEAAWPIWRQVNTMRAGGAELAQMAAEIDAIRDASNVAQAAADAAATHADLYALTW